MSLKLNPTSKSKYPPETSQDHPDTLINFELTQENTYSMHSNNYRNHHLPDTKKNKFEQIDFDNDDDLVYSDHQDDTPYEHPLLKENGKKPIAKQPVNIKENRVLSDCINLDKSKPSKQQRKTNKKPTHPTKYQPEDLKLQFQPKSKTQQTSDQQPSIKSSVLLTNRSVFFTSRSIAPPTTIRFNVKPRASIKQIVSNVYKTDRNKRET